MKKNLYKSIFISLVCISTISCATTYVPEGKNENTSTLSIPLQSNAFLRNLASNEKVINFGILDQNKCTKTLFRPPKPKTKDSYLSTFNIPGNSNMLIQLHASAGAYICKFYATFTAKPNVDYTVKPLGNWSKCSVSISEVDSEGELHAIAYDWVTLANTSKEICVR